MVHIISMHCNRSAAIKQCLESKFDDSAVLLHLSSLGGRFASGLRTAFPLYCLVCSRVTTCSL